MKPIFEYIDYRKYLADFYQESKASKKYFSYRFFAQKAGLNAPILLKMVIDGKRNLSRSSIEKFIRGIGLKEKESLFFRNLVLFNQAKSAMEKQEHYRILRSLSGAVPQFLLENDCFEYFDKWYYSVLREGICHVNDPDNWEKLGECVNPPITADQAREAVAWLCDNGLLVKKENGRYEQKQRAITTRSEVKSLMVRNFNRKMIQLAERSLDRVPQDKRYATGITIGIPGPAYDVFVAEIEAFRDRMVQIVDSLDNVDSVYQVNVQFFPLMQPDKTKVQKQQ